MYLQKYFLSTKDDACWSIKMSFKNHLSWSKKTNNVKQTKQTSRVPSRTLPLMHFCVALTWCGAALWSGVVFSQVYGVPEVQNTNSKTRNAAVFKLLC